MRIFTTRTNYEDLQMTLNSIGWENVLQVVPEKQYNDGTFFVIIYKT